MKRTIFFTSILTLLLFQSCDTLKGHRGISDDIEDAKKRKVFVAEYSVMESSNTQKYAFNIKYSWVEKSWRYGGFYHPDVIGDHFRLIIQMDTTPVGYEDRWVAKMTNDLHHRLECNSYYHFMSSPLYEVPDTLNILFMQKGIKNPDTTTLRLLRKQ